jgi:CheY-like chemotaxis protein
VDLAHERGLKALVALRGSSAISLAREFRPGAITLDINLPDMAGWTILDRLKHDPATRHIPVHIISGDDESPARDRSGRHDVPGEVGNDSLADTFAEIEHSTKTAREEVAGGVRDRADLEAVTDTLARPTSK